MGRKKQVTFILILSMLFLVSDIVTSLSDFANTALYEYLDSRTVRIIVREDGEEDVGELFAWLDENPDMYSYVEDIWLAVTQEETFGSGIVAAYNARALSEYLLTEPCDELGENEAIVAKYIETDEGIYDGEQLLGETITCTICGCDYEITIVGVMDNFAAGGTNKDLYMSEEVLRTRKEEKEAREEAALAEEIWSEEADEETDGRTGGETGGETDGGTGAETDEGIDEEAGGETDEETVEETGAETDEETDEGIDEDEDAVAKADEETDGEADGETDGEMEEEISSDSFPTYLVVAQEYEAAEALIQRANSLDGLWANALGEFAPSDLTLLHGITLVAAFVTLVLLFNASVNMIYVTEHDIRTRRKEFGLLKAIGYRDSVVQGILMREILTEIVGSLSAMALICAAIVAGIEKWADHSLGIFWRNLSFLPSWELVVIVALAGVLAPLIGFLAGAESLRKLDAAESLKER